MVEESRIEEIARFAFPNADDHVLENRKRFVRYLFQTNYRLLYQRFRVLCNNGGISNHKKCDACVAYMAVLAEYDSKVPQAVISKSEFMPEFIIPSLFAVAVKGKKGQLEDKSEAFESSDAIKQAASYLLERM